MLFFIFSFLVFSKTRSKIFHIPKQTNLQSLKTTDHNFDICFYQTNKSLCNDILSFGPNEYSYFKLLTNQEKENFKIFIAEPITLETTLVISNIRCNSITFHGETISGNVFIGQNYSVYDNSGVFRDADISIESSYINTGNNGFLYLTNDVNTPPKSLNLFLTEFPKFVYTTTILKRFYSGPEIQTNIYPSIHQIDGGFYSINVEYYGGNLNWRGNFVSTTKEFCFCPEKCPNSCNFNRINSLDQHLLVVEDNITMITVNLADQSILLINFERLDRTKSYFINGNQNIVLVEYNEQHFEEVPAIIFSNVSLDFDTAEQDITISKTKIYLQNTRISSRWYNKIRIMNLESNLNSLYYIDFNESSKPIVNTNALTISHNANKIALDEEILNKTIENIEFHEGSSNITFEDNTGVTTFISPLILDRISNDDHHTFHINTMNKQSKLTIQDFNDIVLNLYSQSENNIDISNPRKLFVNSHFETVHLNNLMINGTHGSEIISNTNLVINHLNFIDKVISQPEDLFIPLSSSKIQTNHIDIGENNINLIYNLQIDQNLTLEPHSKLNCLNCLYGNNFRVNIRTGYSSPPPKIEVYDPTKSFLPRSISIFVDSLYESSLNRYNVTNPQFYDIITGNFTQEQCNFFLDQVNNLPADYEIQCSNGTLQLKMGDIYPFYQIESYSVIQIVGMVLASLVCATFSFLITALM